MTKRTDCHRPGALVPAHYTSWLDYSMAASEGGFPIPPIGVDCAQPRIVYDATGRSAGVEMPDCPDTGRCCVRSAERHAANEGRAIFGGLGRCGVCGAHYVYGSLFKHDSGELVHMGHDCADKYEMMQDLSAWELQNKRARAALATAIVRSQNQAQRDAILAQHPGLAEALDLGASGEGTTKGQQIIADIAGRFVRFLSISDKQVALVLKLADEIRNPRAVVEERHVAAPEGKGVEFEGTIISAKVTESEYGIAYKMTVKVTTADGATWLAYGTCPASLVDATSNNAGALSELRGRTVAVKATLSRGRDEFFALMNRPSASFTDLFDHPRYQIPRCVIGQPCHIVKRAERGCALLPITCDGSCKNVAKERKPRAKKAGPTVTAAE